MYKAVTISSLGEALLLSTLSSAYYAITKHSAQHIGSRIRDGQQSLYFIKNSGLYQMAQIFGINMDIEKLQNLFFYYVDVA